MQMLANTDKKKKIQIFYKEMEGKYFFALTLFLFVCAYYVRLEYIPFKLHLAKVHST